MTSKKWVVAPRTADDIITQLLHNRGLKKQEEIDNFLNPPHPKEIVKNYRNYIQKIDPNELDKAILMIEKAAASKRPIVIHGDYDVDGICGTAILYQALKKLGAHVTPFIPDRFSEGYGLSIESLDKVQNYEGGPLLITTDCGITAVEAVEHAKSLGFDVIITDHHQPGKSLPRADAIVWTDELAGAGIAWLFSRLAINSLTKYISPAIAGEIYYETLDLVALATIADIQPLLGVNRSLVKYGLVELNATCQVGLKELIRVAGLKNKEVGTYEVSWILAPRLNAAGRLESAAASLKLLVTEDADEAEKLAEKLHYINAQRQQITQQAVDQARQQVAPLHQSFEGQVGGIIVLKEKTWHEGIIGLVAGRIKEEFYRPTIVISQGEEISKGSARSISGFNIVEAIRECGEHLVDAGGHQMAAGFTIETKKIAAFREKLVKVAERRLDQEALNPIISIDARLRPTSINGDLLKKLKQFEPFGLGNPRPTFLTEGLQVSTVRTVGSGNRHLKLWLKSPINDLSCIGFGLGHLAAKIYPGDFIDIVYALEENIWNGQKYLQLSLKDLQKLGG